MFQDTLLIIKCDYMQRRKATLIYLLQYGFQIQGYRKIRFTPELAAEFHQDLADDPCFMFQVILLSKGNSEAFILAKENAVDDLLHSMVCYFGSCMEMERNVHVTRCLGKVRKEISFIFPNYIFEPIYCPDQLKFCSSNTLVPSIINELYDIVTKDDTDSQNDWKKKLAEWLINTNKALPQVSNQCSNNPSLNAREMAQQTRVTAFKHAREPLQTPMGSMCSDTGGTSLNITSSSCVTCSSFGSANECIAQHKNQTLADIIKAKTASLAAAKSSSIIDEMEEIEEEGELDIYEVKAPAVIIEKIEDQGLPLTNGAAADIATTAPEEHSTVAEILENGIEDQRQTQPSEIEENEKESPQQSQNLPESLPSLEDEIVKSLQDEYDEAMPAQVNEMLEGE